MAKASTHEGDLGRGYRCNMQRANWALGLGGVAKHLQILALIILAIFLGRGPLYAQPSPPSRPILFVHGWCGSPYDWAPLYSSLLTTLPDSMYPDKTVYLVQYNSTTDGYSIYRENNPVNNPSDLTLVTLQDIAAYSSSPRFFVIQFYDPNEGGNTDPDNVTRISVLNKAYELKKVIAKIKSITSVTAVNIVSFSMGGLDSRTYVENLASAGSCYNYQDNNQDPAYGSHPNYAASTCLPGSAKAAYANDVANIITVDTPHSGSPLATPSIMTAIYNNAIDFGNLSCQSNPSTNMNELLPQSLGGAGLLEELNYDGSIYFGVSPTMNTVPVQAVSNYFSEIPDVNGSWTGIIGESDDIVPINSQYFPYLVFPYNSVPFLNTSIPHTELEIIGDSDCWIFRPLDLPMLHDMKCLGALSAPQTQIETQLEENNWLWVTSWTNMQSPISLDLGVQIKYSAVDDGEYAGAVLSKVRLWRALDNGGLPGSWELLSNNPDSGSTLAAGSFTDKPSVPGTYWYDVDVLDSLNNEAREPLWFPVTFTSTSSTTYTLTVNSSNPSSGVGITVSPADNDAKGNGTTAFSRSYYGNTQVTLTAPATAGGTYFSNWTGCDDAPGIACTVTMNAAKTVTANYTTTASTYTLTVNSSSPSSGVGITVSPTDNNSLGSGTTSFMLTYNQATQVTLTAPATTSGEILSSWTGCDVALSTTCIVTLTANRAVTANYTTSNTTYVLSVKSLIPSSGVGIAVSPVDNNGDGSGTTSLIRIYNQGTQVTLTAPSTAGGNNFLSWTGCDQASSITCSVTLTATRTVTANYAYKYTNGLGFGTDIAGNVWNIWSANGSNIWDWHQDYVGGYLHYAFKIYDYAGFYCSGSCRSHNVWDKNPTLGFQTGDVLGNDGGIFPESNENNHEYQVDIQWNGGGYHASVYDITAGSAYSTNDYAYPVNFNTYDSWTWGYSLWTGHAYSDEDATTHSSQWTSAIYEDGITGTIGGGGDVRTDALPVVLPPQPTITKQPSNQTATVGANAAFVVAASGTPAPALQWQLSTNYGATWTNLSDVGPYTGTATSTLLITGVPISLIGNEFRAVASNIVGTATSNPAILSVTTENPTIVASPANQSVKAGQSAQFTVVASGLPTPTYSWQRLPAGSSTWSVLSDGGVYSGTATEVLVVTGVTTSMSGDQFRAVATNAAGTVTSNAATLTTLAYSYTYTNGLGFGTDIAGNVWNIWSANGSNIWDWHQNYVGGYLHYAFKIYDYAGYYCSGSCRYHNVWDKNPTFGFETWDVLGNDGGIFPESNENNHVYQVDVQWNGGGYHTSVYDITAGSAYSTNDYAYPIDSNTFDSWTWGSSFWNGHAYTDESASAHALQWTSTVYGDSVTGTTGGGGDVRTDALPVYLPAQVATGAEDFGTVPISQTSAPLSLTLAISNGGTIGSLAAVTQGSAGLDFSIVSTGTCTVGTAYTAGQTCTVKVTFTPEAPGLRMGAVVIRDGNGNVQATVYISGIGTGPLAVLAPGIISTVAGNGTAGYNGDGIAATSAELNRPILAAVDSAGNTYIADNGNGRIRKVSAGTGLISTVAGTGITGYNGDGIAATSAELNGVNSIAVDGAGNIYIADYWNERLRKVSASTGQISTVAGNGTAGYNGDGIAATNAEFSGLDGIAVDSAGNIFVADYSNNRIRKVSASTGLISTVAGTGVGGFNGDGITAISAELNSPFGVALDSSGNIYISDLGNERIRKVSVSTGLISTVAGIGTPGYNGDGIAATSAEFYFPSGIAVDSAGNIYIADYVNQRIRKVDASTGLISTMAGNGDVNGGTGGGYYNGDGISATRAELNNPFGVALGSAGDIYISDGGNERIRKVSASVSALNFVNTNVSSTSSDSPQTVTLSNNGNATLTFPIPSSGANPSISTNFNLNSTGATACPLIGSTASSAGTLAVGASCTLPVNFVPTSAGSISGSLVLTDNNLNASSATQTIALNGTATGGSGGTATLSSITVAPASAAISIEGTQQFTATGTFSDSSTQDLTRTVSWTSSNTGSATINASGLATGVAGGSTDISASLSGVNSNTAVLAVNSDAYVAPTEPVGTTSGMQTVTIPLPNSFTLGSISLVTQGVPNLDFNIASGGTCTVGTAYLVGQTCTVEFTFTPKAPGLRMGGILLLDGGGFVKATQYISGTGTGPQVSFFPGGQSTIGSGFISPKGVVTDASGDVFVADSNGVLELLAASGYQNGSFLNGVNNLTGVAVDGAGNIFVTNSGSNTVKEFLVASGSAPYKTLSGTYNAPSAVAVDGAGNVFVADTGNNAVKEFVAASGSVNTLGSGFNSPTGIAVDGAGNIFVGDAGNHAVKEITKASGYANVVPLGIVLGVPMGVAVDPSGNIFVADSSGNAVEEILVASGYTKANTLGNGFDAPTGVAVDPSGNVFVADSLNNRVVKLDLADAPSLSFASTPVGSTSNDSPKTVTLANSGNVALTFPVPSSGNNPSISTNFTLDSSGATACPLNGSTASSPGALAVGASCTLPISFGPTSVGSISGSLVLTDNNMNTPGATQTILLNGTGTGGSIGTTTNLSSSLNPSSYGQSLTITAAVAAVNVTAQPTGTVQFSIDGSAAGSAAAVSGGIATYTTTALSVGTHSVTAVYSPTTGSYFTTSSAAALSQVVNKVAPGVTVTPSSSSITTAQSLSVTIVVNGGTGNPIPTGSITLSGGGYTSAATSLSSGSTTINIPAGSLAVGVDTLTASYAPDSGSTPIYITSTGSTPVTVTSFTKTTPTVLVTPSTSSITTAQALSVTISVSGTPVPAGVVTLTGGGYASAATTLVGGSTLINIPAGSLAVGVDTLTVTYTPDSGSSSNYNGASGATSVTVSNSGTVGGAQLNFLPGSQSTRGSGFKTPSGVAVDGSGNIFVADSDNNAVKEILAAGSYTAVKTLGSGFSIPKGVAVDASGNVFVADYANNAVKEILATGGFTTINTLGSGFNGPSGVAVDASGNVFVADYANNAVKEILATGGYTTIKTLGSGFSNPYGVAVDGSGNVFVADHGNNAIKEILAAGGYTTVNSLVPTGFGYSGPSGVAVDKKGNLFFSDMGSGTSRVILAVGGYTVIDTLGSGFNVPEGVAVDGVGNVFVADTNNDQVVELNFANAPSLSFNTTAVGSTSTDSPRTVTLWNNGEGTLTFSIPSSGNNPTISTNFTLGSAGGTACPVTGSSATFAGTLAAGTSCTLSISFVPSASGTISGSLTLTDNNLNVSNATQTIPLTGIATSGTTSTTTTLGSSQNPSTFGQSVTITATVAATSGTATPTGTVQFSVDGNPAGLAVTLNGGTATYVTSALVAGTHGVTAIYSPLAGSAFGTSSAIALSQVVNHATPNVNWATPAAINYGTALSAIQFNATATYNGSNVVGNFGYTPILGTVPGAGTQTLSVTFTPTDTTDYSSITKTVSLTVNQATPALVLTCVEVIYDGNPHTCSGAATGLNGVVLVGAWGFNPSSETNAGSYAITGTFTSTDPNYAGGTTGGTLKIDKATPTITWATPAPITYGTALSATQLNATSSAVGSFVYAPASGTVMTAGSQILSATFTPTDSTNYISTNKTVSLTVNQAKPTITWATPSSIVYGTALSGTQLNASASVPGTFVYNPAAGIILPVGGDALSVRFTPTDLIDYVIATSTVQLTVSKATPALTVTPAASNITTAQSLSVTVGVTGGSGTAMPTGSVTLTSGGYSSAATTLGVGSVTITIPAGSLPIGTDTLTASYSPDSPSSSTYNSGIGSNSVTVTTTVNPSFTISGTAVSVAPGETTGNNSTITVTPVGGFTGSVALTASITSSPSGAQHLPTLSFGSTNPVAIAGTSAGTATLTISTTAAGSAALVYPKRLGVPWYPTGSAVLAGILLFGIPRRRRAWRTMLGMVTLLVALAGGMLACTGGSIGSNGGSSSPGTTAGTYTITLTGTSGSTTNMGTVSLTVK
jgi:sugar lactone lactonase YvrE